jgi:hypothetical protein
MVDNVSISEGDGDKTIATDDVGGVQYQRIKISWGGDGNATEVDTASGKPFPVQLRGSAGGDVVKLEDDASANADPGGADARGPEGSTCEYLRGRRGL